MIAAVGENLIYPTHKKPELHYMVANTANTQKFETITDILL